MVLDLSAPLAWRAAVDAVEMLDNLQANILTPHVRDHLRVLMLDLADSLSARTFLAELAEQGMVKSARTHLAELDAFRAARVPGSPYVGVGLSSAGYALVAPSARPDDPAFVRGMTCTRPRGADTAVRSWLPQYRQVGSRIHAVVIVSDAVEAPALSRVAQIRELLPQAARVVARESATTPPAGEGAPGRENRCRPVFLTEEETTPCHPHTPLSRVLVREPGSADDDNRCGTYLTVCKFEHNGPVSGDPVSPDPAAGRTDVAVQRGQPYGTGLLTMTFGSRVLGPPRCSARNASALRGGECFFLPSLGFLRTL